MPMSLPAQAVVPVQEPSSSRYSIVLDSIFTLRDHDGQAGLSYPLAVELTGTGGILVVPSARQGDLLLFDSAGSYVRRVGRRGEGPGEYTAILDLERTPGDSMAVLDPGSGRFTLLEPDLGRVARTARLPMITGQMEILRDGRVLLMGPVATAAGTGRIHLLKPSMETITSFYEADYQEDRVVEAKRRFAATDDGKIAVAHVSSYTVEMLRLTGESSGMLERDPPWFSDVPGSSSPRQTEAPRARQERPHFDASGRLWTLLVVPDEDWRTSLDTVRGLYGQPVRGVPRGAQGQHFDTVIEVIDLTSREVVASARFDPLLLFLLDGGLAASYREDDTGLPFLHVWRLVLREVQR